MHAHCQNIRLIFFSDTHIGFDEPARPSRAQSSRPRRGPDFFANYERVLDYAISTEADAVVHGGDFFFRSRVAPHIVDTAYQALWACADAGIPICIVPGNHERSALPPSLLLGHPNILVFDRPRTFTIEVGGLRLALAGFPNDRNEVRRRFRSWVDATGHATAHADVKLLCIHQTAEGAVVGPGRFEFTRGPDVISRHQLIDLHRHFDAVLSGHIHRHQVLSYGALRLFYCGSVERTSYAEKDETKGFLDLTIQARRGQTTITPTFVSLPARPMVEVEIDPTAPESKLAHDLSNRSFPPRSIVRLRSRAGPYPGALTRAVLDPLFADETIYQLHPSLFAAASGTRRDDTAPRSRPSRRSTGSDAGAPSA